MTKAQLNSQMMRLACRFGTRAEIRATDVFEIVKDMPEQKFKTVVDIFLSCREHTDPPTLNDFEACALVPESDCYSDDVKAIAKRRVNAKADSKLKWWEHFL